MSKPRRKPGILDRLRNARSLHDVHAALSRLGHLPSASDRTFHRAQRIASRRRKELLETLLSQ